LKHAYANTSRIAAAIQPDQWHAPTPCAEWDVREILVHATWVATMFTCALGGTEAPPRNADLLGDEPASAFRVAGDRAIAAWATHGMEGTVTLAAGSLPADAALCVNILDVYVHGWDLARATNQDPHLDPNRCEQLLAFCGELSPDIRRGRFEPVIDVAGEANIVDRFIAYTGRDPLAQFARQR
jgi:uncharacterized protein (TIGR03086 family)